jgi:hypothetical protein
MATCGTRGVASRPSIPPGTPVVGPTGDRGTVAADINDRGEILLPIPGGLLKGRAVPVGG